MVGRSVGSCAKLDDEAALQKAYGRSLAVLQSRDHWLSGKVREGHSGPRCCLDLILYPRPIMAMPLPLRPDGVHRQCGHLPLWLREVFPGVLAWVAGIICGSRAGAGLRSGHIIGIALIVPDQHHICGEPAERGHFRWFLAVVLEGD